MTVAAHDDEVAAGIGGVREDHVGDVDAAEDAYSKGADAAGDDMRAIGSARRQLQWLVPALGLTPETVRGPAPPTILYPARDD